MLLSLMSPEERFLFLAANETPAALPRAGAAFDWVELCRLAEREKAVPLLWQRIEAAPEEERPGEAGAHLRKLARVTSFHMAYLEQLVLTSTASLERAGVDYTLLKGAAMACSFYGSFGDRPMVDVDILVHPNDAQRAVDALLASGWVWRADKDRNADFSHLHHLPALVDSNSLVSAEIHTSVLPLGSPFGIGTEAVLASSRKVSFRGSEIRVPDPLYLLLHACVHFAWSHLFRSGAFRTFRDVNALISNRRLDWKEFLTLARAHHAETCCFWTLHLARELVGAKVPIDVLRALRPPLPSGVLATLERHFTLILVPSGISCPSVSLRRLMWAAGILPRRSGHGAMRPWIALELKVEDRPVREARLEAQQAVKSRRSGRQWIRYWTRVILPAPASR